MKRSYKLAPLEIKICVIKNESELYKIDFFFCKFVASTEYNCFCILGYDWSPGRSSVMLGHQAEGHYAEWSSGRQQLQQ